MILRRTRHFLKAYASLDKSDQPRVDKALVLLVQNPRHPSLHLEKVASDIWSIRASQKIRITLRYVEPLDDNSDGDIELRNVGYHQQVYRSP